MELETHRIAPRPFPTVLTVLVAVTAVLLSTYPPPSFQIFRSDGLLPLTRNGEPEECVSLQS